MKTYKIITTLIQGAILFSVVILSGCTGVPMKTANLNEGEYTIIGHGEATATGIMLFNVIPIKQNNRFVRAQNAAIKSKGGDAMINTQIKESWFWAYILNGYKTTVSGDIVKLNKNKYSDNPLETSPIHHH